MSIGVKPELGHNMTNVKRYGFRIALDAANAPTLSEGRGASVARTGVGVYTITLADLPASAEFKYAMLTLNQAAGALDLRVTSGGYNSTTGVFTFFTSLTSTGAQANPPAVGAQNFVSVELVFGSPTE